MNTKQLYKEQKANKKYIPYNFNILASKYQRRFFLFAKKREDNTISVVVVKAKKPLNDVQKLGYTFENFQKESCLAKDIVEKIKELEKTSKIVIDSRGFSLEELKELIY